MNTSGSTRAPETSAAHRSFLVAGVADSSASSSRRTLEKILQAWIHVKGIDKLDKRDRQAAAKGILAALFDGKLPEACIDE